MRIDSHQHFWRYDPAQYPWMSQPLAALRRDYLPGDLQPLLQATGFDGSIAVQARQSIAETEWLLQLAEANPLIKGVVGWVDLRAPDLRKQLERFSPNPKLVGVRHVLQDEPEDEFMLQPDFRRGISQLDAFDLAYDLLLFPRHLPVAAKLVAEFPNQRFVLDHLAKPGIREGLTSPWDDDLRRLAQFPNVYCKLSGLVTEANWKQWRAAEFYPYLDAAVASFGPERLMIGSDWPVCTVAGDYAATLEIVIRYLRQFSAAEQAGILGGNCARFYRI